MKSFKPEVIADRTGKWYGNQLRFATYEEAHKQVVDLMARWTAVSNVRVVETDDPVTHRYIDGRSIPLAEAVEKLQ